MKTTLVEKKREVEQLNRAEGSKSIYAWHYFSVYLAIITKLGS